MMMRKMWMLFILTMATSKAEDSKANFSDDKETRFLTLFAVGGDGRPPPPPLRPAPGPPLLPLQGGRCASRLETALDHIKRRQMSKARHEEVPVQMINLDGYSLSQHMRSAPVNMYVTRMRVRLPQNQNWVRIERCFFDPRNVSLETRLLFSDLTISGSVNLHEGNDDLDKSNNLRESSGRYDRDTFYDNRDFQGRIRYRSDDSEDDDRLRSRDDYYERSRRDCNMILRLRKAGIGFFTQPLNQSPGRFSVKTDSEFIEPGFISVYAYGCEKYISRRRNQQNRNYHDNDYKNRQDNQLDKRQKRQIDEFKFEPYAYDDRERESHYGRSRQWEPNNQNHRMEKSKLFSDDEQLDDIDEISREMEDIFTKGIRSLLTTYMQKELQPAIKETLMRNLGYTLSYGR